MSKYFNDLIGLENTKKQLEFYLDNFKVTKIMPNILLSATRGNGKTMLARLIGKAIGRKYVEVNCSSIDTLDEFFVIVNQHIVNAETTIFFDEAEAIPVEMALALCTILNGSDNNMIKYNHGGVEYTFDFTKISMVFATTEAQKIYHALLDRLYIIDLDAYTEKHLEQILNKYLKEFNIERGLLANVAKVVRTNPRQARKLATDISSFLNRKNTKDFTNEHWAEFANQLGINKLGLTGTEIKLLKILKQYPNSSLTRVASMLNATTEATRRFVEQYPLRTGLLEIHNGTGRKLSPAGYDYVNKLEEINAK